MKICWKPIIGAVGALVSVKIIGRYFGMCGSLIALGVLLLCWLGVHLLYMKLIDKLCAQYANMTEERKTEWLAQITPSIRKDVERRNRSA